MRSGGGVLSLAGVSRVNDSALADVLSIVVEMPPGAPLARRQIGSATGTEWHAVGTAIDVPVDKRYQLRMAPLPLGQIIDYFIVGCPHFRRLAEKTIATQGEFKHLSHMNEVSPRPPLRPDDQKSHWGISCSFVEFGSAVLPSTIVWMPLAVLLGPIGIKAVGGFANCVRLLPQGSWTLAASHNRFRGTFVRTDYFVEVWLGPHACRCRRFADVLSASKRLAALGRARFPAIS